MPRTPSSRPQPPPLSSSEVCPKAPPPDDPPVICRATKYVYDLQFQKWVECPMVVKVKRANRYLGSGGMRICYEVQELEATTEVDMIAKFFQRAMTNVVEVDYFNEASAQCRCEDFAQAFNRIRVAASVAKPTFSFLQCAVVRIPAVEIPARYQAARHGFFSYRPEDSPRDVMFIMEPVLTGKFTKYNSNFGDVYSEDKKAKFTTQEKERRTLVVEGAEAFSHFSLVESAGAMLVCDLQGVNDFLTDPQIHANKKNGFGMGNLGPRGILKWVDSHKCGALCVALKLEPLEQNLTEEQRINNATRYSELVKDLRRQRTQGGREAVNMAKSLEDMTESEQLIYAIELSKAHQ